MKTCVLFSGGWDSAAATILNLDSKPDLLFINYNQNYLVNEFRSAQEFADYFNLNLIIKTLGLGHDAKRRNFHLVMEAYRLEYRRIIIGARNVIPLFDAYKDSNYVSLKLLGWLLGCQIDLPVVGWRKKKILQTCFSKYPKWLYNCYFNNDNRQQCSCSNCKQIQLLINVNDFNKLSI